MLPPDNRLRLVSSIPGCEYCHQKGSPDKANNQKHMAAPLVLQFFIGLTMQVVFTSTSTLLVDLHPECPSTAQAASNLVRCEMSAGMLALLDLLLGKLGPGWCFVLFAALALVSIPLLYLLQRRGMS